jgi:hypothetical protein
LLCSMGRNLQLSSRAQEEEDSKRKTEYFFFGFCSSSVDLDQAQ